MSAEKLAALIQEKCDGITGLEIVFTICAGKFDKEALMLVCKNIPSGETLWVEFTERRDSPDTPEKYRFSDYLQEKLGELRSESTTTSALRSINWYKENGCELASPSTGMMLEGIFHATGGNPCNGCSDKNTCETWPLVDGQVPALVGSATSTETNAEAALRLNISKRQASKLRKAGKL